jgi:hypothetical protein
MCPRSSTPRDQAHKKPEFDYVMRLRQKNMFCQAHQKYKTVACDAPAP